MTNAYRLGLDIGTNSLGWALWKLGPDGRESGKGEILGGPLAVRRRNARSMRRRRDRYLQRKHAFVNLLVRENLWPENPALCIGIYGLDPYSLRAKALSEQLIGKELGRVLLHISQRRGFKSNRKADSKDNESRVSKKRIAALDKALAAGRSQSLGEFLNARKERVFAFVGKWSIIPTAVITSRNSTLSPRGSVKYYPELDWKRLEGRHFLPASLKTPTEGQVPHL